MAEERVLESFNFQPGAFDKVDAWDGATQPKPGIGDYRLKITGVRERMQEGKNTYKMALIDYQIVAAHDEVNKQYVGMDTSSAYAGDMNAPDAMVKRTKHLFFNALKLTAPPKSPQEIIGREIDATVCWRVGEGKSGDPLKPQPKRYVNVDIKGERPPGTPRPKGLNPQAESAAAIAVENGTAGQPQAWEQPGVAVPQAATPASIAAAAQQAPQAPAAQGEAWGVDAYRAVIAIGHPLAGQAKGLLEAQQIPVDGPIDQTKLPVALRDLYTAHLAKAQQAAPSNGLPALSLS